MKDRELETQSALCCETFRPKAQLFLVHIYANER
jgi:hypothetical protein